MLTRLKSISVFILCFTLFIQCDRNRNRDGVRLYEQQCLNCHQESGQGVGKLTPALTDTDYLRNHRNMLPCILEHGMEGPLTINGIDYDEKMPSIERLSDADMVNLLNYIGQNWGNDLETFTIKEIIELRKNCDQSK